MQPELVSEPKDAENPTSYDHLVPKILEKTEFKAKEFQLKASQAILNGRDVVVHAATGCGKTLVFAAPQYFLDNSVSIVISPLILLQQDQQKRMEKMQVTLIAVNREVHIDPKTWSDIAEGKYEIIFLSPEMAIHSEEVNKVFASEAFRKASVAIHIDEAHTISLWGGDFRKDYQQLGRIRAGLPKGVPVGLFSATLRPNVKQDAMSTLGFSSDPKKYANVDIGNERFNVFIGTHPMTHPASSFKNILLFFDPNETDPSKIDKVIIYIDNVNNVTRAVIALYDWLHPSLRDRMVVVPVHAWMTPEYRSKAMAKFASGEVRIIVATEAAGMGCDISDIKRVIQFGVCSSIDAFMQRIGRVWRGPDGTGEGWLIYEKWVPKCKKHTGPSSKGKASSSDKKSSAPDNDAKTSTKNERKCDLLVQQLVLEPVCRRRYLNRVYDNQRSETVVPPHECCDICDPNSAARIPDRKFPAERGPPRAARVSGDSNPAMLSCLRAWRRKTFLSVFGNSSMFGASALISDDQLERISRCAPVPSIQRLNAYLVKWPSVNSHLESMWEALKAGGFALPVPESAETAAPESTPASHSQSAPGPSVSQASRKSSKRRHAEIGALEPQSKDTLGSSSVQQPAADTWSWREYAGAHNHEVRHSTMDDLRRLLTGQTGAQSHEESAQRDHPPTPSPTAKRPRLESRNSSRRDPRGPPPAPRASSTLPPAPSTTLPAIQTPMRLITPPIVPSQRPRSPAAKRPRLNRRDMTDQAPHALLPAPYASRMPPPAIPTASSTFQTPALRPVGQMIVPSQRPDSSSTQAPPDELYWQPLDTTVVAPLRQHQPLPVPASRFAYFDVPYFRPLPPHVPVLYRPPGPPPCNLALNLVNPPPVRQYFSSS